VYKLLIVDDEPLSQVGLKSMLDWAGLDVEIVGSAPNGLAALEEIERLRPDIAIVDLRMPLLDGLGLLERCRAEPGGGPEFIVLTGYADFESLRRAMRGSAIDYLVKLELDEASLRASVEKAKAAVREKRKIGLASPAGAGGRDPFAETALTRLLLGSFAGPEEARLSLERSGLSLGEGGFRVASFRVDYANAERLSEDERLRIYCCAIDMIKQIVGREASVLVVPFDVFSFSAILSGAASAARAAEALDRARDMTEKYFGVGLRGGLGSERREAIRAADSYREARVAMEAAAGPGGTGVLAFEELRYSRSAAPQARREARRAALIEAVSARSAEALRAVADEALEELASPEMGSAEALALCCELLYPILERLEDAEAFLDSLFPGEREGWRCLFSAQGPAAARSWLATVGEGLRARFESARSRGRNPLVAGVRGYVLENYASRLSLAEVARRFEVSPNHLSALFKKYAGVGFAEFVAQVKVEKAKELIAEGRYKMFEVAQLLGFEDAFYFSKVFKRVSGMSPRDFFLHHGTREPTKGE
jgi:two-component system response regulator YesN